MIEAKYNRLELGVLGFRMLAFLHGAQVEVATRWRLPEACRNVRVIYFTCSEGFDIGNQACSLSSRKRCNRQDSFLYREMVGT